MKDAPSISKEKEHGKEKGKAPIYKLQLDIEVVTDLKKVLEECISNGKVEFTLGEVLAIAKTKFHKVIIDIIKKKRQTMEETMISNAQGTRVMEGEEIDDFAHRDVSQVRFMM